MKETYLAIICFDTQTIPLATQLLKLLTFYWMKHFHVSSFQPYNASLLKYFRNIYLIWKGHSLAMCVLTRHRSYLLPCYYPFTECNFRNTDVYMKWETKGYEWRQSVKSGSFVLQVSKRCLNYEYTLLQKYNFNV